MRALAVVVAQSGQLAAFGGFFTFFGLLLFVASLRIFAGARRAKDTAVAKIASVAVGRAAVQGTATARTIARTPFLGIPYLRAEIVIEEMSTDADDKPVWTTRHRAALRSSPTFTLGDGEAAILIDDRVATLTYGRTATWANDRSGFLSDTIASYLSPLDLAVDRGDWQIHESVIEPETTVFVEGTVVERSRVTISPDAVDRETPLVVDGSRSPMIVSAGTRDAFVRGQTISAGVWFVGSLFFLVPGILMLGRSLSHEVH